MIAMDNNDHARIYIKSDYRIGSEAYYDEAMACGFYGVEDDGRAFKVVEN